MRASRPTFARKVVAAPFGRALAAVCRGGPWPSRKPLRRRKAPGPMRASAPTGVCYNAEGAASWSAACPPLAVGADSISARGVCGGLEPPGRYRIGPYRGLLYRGGAASRLAAMFPALRRAGVHARRTAAISKPGKPGRSYRRKVRRDEGIPPYVCPEGRGRPVWPGACRGLRGRAVALPYPHAAARFPGRCEHRPLQGFVIKRGMRLPALRRPVILTRNRTKNAPAQTRRGRQNAAARLTCTLRSCS